MENKALFLFNRRSSPQRATPKKSNREFATSRKASNKPGRVQVLKTTKTEIQLAKNQSKPN